MASVFFENLRILNAKNFKDMISSANTKLYFTFGRATPWANDAAPDQANTSVTFFNEVWDSMIGAKLITGNDVIHVIPRINWTVNTSYNAYDSSIPSEDLHNTNNKFYVVTSDFNVYKCLSNNNGKLSTVEPKQIQTNRAVEEIDGYVWKYMYSIDAAMQMRYTTDSFIPVSKLSVDNGSLQWDVQENAISGAIESIKIKSPGSGHTAANLVLTITGDGTNANALARVNTVSGQISNVIMTNIGSGYSYATISIPSAANGTGAIFEPMISPSGGHGSDALFELGGSYLLLNPRIKYDENEKFPTENDFRQITIIKDPYEAGTSNAASSTVYTGYLKLILNSGVTTFEKDEIVYQGTSYAAAYFTGRVLSYEQVESNYILKLVNVRGTPTVDVIIGLTSGTSRFIESITEPGLEKYTGKLIYGNNIEPITRASDQIEDFKIVLKF